MNETKGSRYLFSEEIKGYNETQPTPMPNLDKTLSLSSIMKKINSMDAKIIQLAESINKIAYNMEVALHRLSFISEGSTEEYPDREMPEMFHFEPQRENKYTLEETFKTHRSKGSEVPIPNFNRSEHDFNISSKDMRTKDIRDNANVNDSMKLFFGTDRGDLGSDASNRSYIRNPFSAFFDMPLTRMVNLDSSIHMPDLNKIEEVADLGAVDTDLLDEDNKKEDNNYVEEIKEGDFLENTRETNSEMEKNSDDKEDYKDIATNIEAKNEELEDLPELIDLEEDHTDNTTTNTQDHSSLITPQEEPVADFMTNTRDQSPLKDNINNPQEDSVSGEIDLSDLESALKSASLDESSAQKNKKKRASSEKKKSRKGKTHVDMNEDEDYIPKKKPTKLKLVKKKKAIEVEDG
jgi:hypothetical protein